MISKPPVKHYHAVRFCGERLEDRLNLSCISNAPISEQDGVTRAAEAINCFAFDLYDHFEQEPGNLFLSPASIATALAMTYAGAAGDTATQMENTLHFGSELGIHDAFRDLIEALGRQDARFELQLANALWPQQDFPFHEDFIRDVELNYGGKAEPLDYAQPQQAADRINAWVDEQTRGKIQELVIANDLTNALMVLTNSIYFKALWASPFDGFSTSPQPFVREDGQTVSVPTMRTQIIGRYTELDGLQVLDMPFSNNDASMVLLLPTEGAGTDVETETFLKVTDWLDAPRGQRECMTVNLPKFTTTVSSSLERVLSGLGMPSAFSSSANFSKMFDAGLFIDQVLHKATIEVTELGTEAAAATAVGQVLCFAEGTPVLTPDGPRPIEELQAGDYVLSRNEHNVEGEVRAKRIEETFQGHKELVGLRIGDQVIRCTSDHRFFAEGRGWTAAIDLQTGDTLATDGAAWQVVKEVAVMGETQPVYNFRVADDHTYFVGDEKWGFAVWTHNCYGVVAVDRAFHFMIRDNATSTILFMGRISDPLQTDNELNPQVESDERLPGDTDGNGEVDFEDFVVLANNFGRQIDTVWEDGDFDGNGAVDFDDYVILSENFGATREGAPIDGSHGSTA